ncbi:MAG: DUF2017 family protein, partial [Streptosporangiaceae bacterium]
MCTPRAGRSWRRAPARRWNATWKSCTGTACGPRSSRTSKHHRETLEVPITGFRGVRGGGVTARFAAVEAMLLRDLVSQVAEIVSDGLPQRNGELDAETAALEELAGVSDSSSVPDDPVLARLLPDAYRDDEDAAGEFR